MGRRKTISVVLGMGAIVLIAAGWFQREEAQAEHTSIRIGTDPWPGYEYLHLADRKGFFKEENVPIQLIRFSSLEDARRAYEHHQVDGMATTVIEVLQAHEHGAPAKVAIVTDFSNGADVIIARKGIASVAGLKGKKVGIEPATLSGFILARALNKVGLSLEDVKTEGLSPLNMEAALLSGKVDAVHAYPPISLAILKHTGEVTKIFDSSQIPEEIVDIVSINPDIVANRPEDIKALQRAWDKAHAYAAAHPEEANMIMAGYEDISAEEFTEALRGIKVLSFSEQEALMKGSSLRQTIAQVGDVLRKEGELKEAVDPGIFLIGAEGTQ